MKQRQRQNRRKMKNTHYASNRNYTENVVMMGTKKRRSRWPFVVGIILLVIAGLGAYYWYQSTQPQEIAVVEVDLEEPNLPRIVSLE